MPSYRLTYFDIKGLAEPIRLAFTIGQVPFEDIRVTKDEWAAKKATMPFAQLPILEVDGKIICQSQSILRYAGKLSGTYPKDDDLLAMRIDEVLGCIGDIRMKLVPSMYEPDEDKKLAMRKKFADEQLPEWCQRMEAYFAANGQTQFAAGSSLSIADLELGVMVSWFTSGMIDHLPSNCFDSYPMICKIAKSIEENDKVKAYYAARG